MYNYLPLLGFFNAFFSPLGMISYLCAFSIFKVKLGLFDTLFILYSLSLLLVNLFFFDAALVLSTFRFYFGFICFYIYFKSGKDFPVKNIFILLLILVPLEAFLINTLISPHSMPNFPNADALSHFNPGGYQRPYSFGGNSSVSSSILVVLLSMVSISSLSRYIAIGNVFIFSSGSGLISLFLLFLANRMKLIAMSFIVIFVVVVVYHAAIIDFVDALGGKVNSKYILFLIDFKFIQVTNNFKDFTFVDYLFGSLTSIRDGYGGDFGWLYFVLGYGFFSFFVLVFFITSKATKETIIPITISILATFHYPVIFFLPGQIVLGYLMAQKYRCKIS